MAVGTPSDENHMSDGGQSDPELRSTRVPPLVAVRLIRGMGRNKAYRWLSIPEQPPVDFGEPFMLFDFARTALAPQSCKFVLVKQSDDDVFARSKISVNILVSLLFAVAVRQPEEA